ncbi:MAG TPA: fibronectin type III domain-containing protein [Polyangiaceae bacterium]|nr:fibronectin type III domain-containing protein [Polyangiaceae bacterium]
MPSKASHRRFIVVLKSPRSADAYIVYGHAIVTSMTGNSWFPKPSPSLGKVKAGLKALEKAQAATLMGGMGKATARNDLRDAVHRLLQQLASYVQKIANAHPEEALAIIQSSGMSAKKGSGSRAHVSRARRHVNSGSARLTQPVAGDRASYRWQKSLDGCNTWIDLPDTTQSSTVVHDLKPGTTVHFRHKAVTLDGEGDWSDPIAYIVD